MGRTETLNQYNNNHIPLFLVFIEDMKPVIRTLDGELIFYSKLAKLMEDFYDE